VRLGLQLPHHLGGTVLVGLALVLVHARIMLSSETVGVLGGVTVRELLHHGANWAPLSLHGEPWRLLTAIFLHGGLLHLFFNLMALSQVGPAVETLFGRGLFFVLFLASGVVASLGSALVPPAAPSIGASGAVMGLIGVTAGWGHRHGGPVGRNVRGQMLKWAAYVGVFGLLVPGIDNAAHATGFLAGGALGLVVDPRGQGRWRAVVGTVAGLACLLGALAALRGGFLLPGE
jgi:rhomboid protease GluP